MRKFWDRFKGFWRGGQRGRLIYIFGAMILFFVLFDGVMSYLLPLVITAHGFSKTLVGIILSSAAVSGAFFDFVIYKMFKEVIYRRLFIIMFGVGILYVLTVWGAHSLLMYLAAMLMWGFYYDLKNFGTLDLVSRHSTKKEIPSSFGILQAFQSVGYLLAPLIAGFVIIDRVGWTPFAVALTFLSISALFFARLVFEAREVRHSAPHREDSDRAGLLEEFALWKKAGTSIFPVLLLTSFSMMFDSFFMALGPIVAETLPLEPFDGFFMVAYFLPPLVIGGIVGSLVKRYGEKGTAISGLLIGASILSSLFFFHNPLLIISVVFIAACFTSVMTPVAQSIYAHVIHDSPKCKKEVQELSDFFGNCGYIVGPVTAGLIADLFGSKMAFSVLGLLGIACAILLSALMPKKILMKGFKGKD